MALEDHPMWRKPQHHEELDDAHDHVHWVELFYDLIHVVTIFVLGNFLGSHDPTLGTFLIFAGIFSALWFAWGELSVFNSIFVSTDIWHRIIMATLMISVMFMAASIPSVDGKGWPFFVVGFAVNRFMIAALYYRAEGKGRERDELCREMVRNLGFMGVYFLIVAFIPKPYAYWAFGAGVVMTQLFYMIPSITPLRLARFAPRMGHIVERFALLTLIVLGEGFFKLVVTLADKGIYKVSPEVLLNFVISGFSIFMMCWMYFDYVGNAKPKDNRLSTMVKLWLGHLALMMSAVMVGVAFTGEVKVGFWENFPYHYAVYGCFGLAGYIGSLWLLQNQVEFREAHRFADWRVRMFGIVMAFVTLMVVPYVPAIVGNMLWLTALFSQGVVPYVLAVKTYSKE